MSRANRAKKIAYLRAAARSQDDACILWQWSGAGAPSGKPKYGRFMVRGRYLKAHRVSLQLKLRRSLLPGEQAQHTCDNPPCINGRHLKPGDNGSNLLDALARQRRRPVQSKLGAEHHSARLDVEKVRAIRALRSSGFPSRKIAAQFGITDTAVDKICARKTWRHVP